MRIGTDAVPAAADGLRVRVPRVDELADVIRRVAEWTTADGPVQLHPGDIGWHERRGAETTAAALRIWERDGTAVAVGLVDGDVLRIARDPAAEAEAAPALADAVGASVVAGGPRIVEVPNGSALRARLVAHRWRTGEAWVPLRLDLATAELQDPTGTGDGAHPGTRVVVLDAAHPDPALVADRTAVQRAGFGVAAFTDERWHAMAAGSAYADARCLVGYDSSGAAAAIVTVWSAGPGRAGLIEPFATHPDLRRRGHGRATLLAGCRVLADLGATCVDVVTPAANEGGVAAYVGSGFEALPLRTDLEAPETLGPGR